jgi:hypothetical protein
LVLAGRLASPDRGDTASGRSRPRRDDGMSPLARTRSPVAEPTRDRTVTQVAAAVFAFGFVVWLATSLVTGRVERWPRIYDDAYYYFGIAQNVVDGYGLTMDRLDPASGFHPLWMYVLIPIFALTRSHESVSLAIVQVLQIGLWALSSGFLFTILRQPCGALSAWMAVAVLIFPRYLNQLTAGLEGGLLLLLLLYTIRRLATREPERRRAEPVLGVWLGLVLLARLDTVFVAFSLACWLLVGDWQRATWKRQLWPSMRWVLLSLWPTIALVVPFLLFNKLYFGHAMPLSGMLKSSFPHVGFNVRDLDPSQLLLFGCGIVAASGRLNAVRGRLLSLTRALVIGNAAHLLYMMLFMKWAVFPWYFISFYPAGVIGIAGMLAPLLRTRAPGMQLATAALWTGALFASVGVSLATRVGNAWYETPALEAARWVDRNLDANAILAMKDSGAFSFFSHRRVMNLDGLANSLEYERALCTGHLEEFLQAKGVGYISQHSLLAAVQSGYGEATMVYPCHLNGGEDGRLLLRERDEVYRGSLSYDGEPLRFLIWRLPEEQPK